MRNTHRSILSLKWMNAGDVQDEDARKNKMEGREDCPSDMHASLDSIDYRQHSQEEQSIYYVNIKIQHQTRVSNRLDCNYPVTI